MAGPLIQVSEIDKDLFPFIGYVQAVFPTQIPGVQFSVGSGTLIGPRVVLTAGHVVYDASKQGFATQVDVTFNGLRPVRAQTVQTNHLWIQQDASGANPLSAYDYGVIILPEAIDQPTWPIACATTSDAELTSLTLNVAGYPAQPASIRGQLFRGVSRASLSKAAGNFRMFYPIHTLGGMSGGPVYDVSASHGRTVRGVHTSLVPVPGTIQPVGSAFRFTDQSIAIIGGWLDKFGA